MSRRRGDSLPTGGSTPTGDTADAGDTANAGDTVDVGDALDVAVVGAGPAGLAAVTTCLAAGLRVALVDRAVTVGGQYWRRPAPSTADGALDPRSLRDLHHDLATFDALRARLDEGCDLGLLALLLRTQVWTAVRDDDGTFVLHTADTGAGRAATSLTGTVRARRLVLATGAHDVALPFPGWDLPGVHTVGGLQALLKGSDVLAGRRVVLGGTGPFLLPVAAGLASRGATVVGVHEASSPTRWARHLRAIGANAGKLTEGLAYGASLARHRVPVHARSMMVQAHGGDRVEAVTVQRLDAAGHLVAGTTRQFEVDTVGVGWGFSPIVDLAVTLGAATRPGPVAGVEVTVDHDQRSSVPGLLVAGEATGVGGAGLALLEGETAGARVVDDLAPAAGASRRRRHVVARRRAAQQTFAEALHTAHPVPAGWVDALTGDTLLCRCEEVTTGAVRDAMRAGADSARQVKQLTRAGMGWCQGRTCEPACALLVAATIGAAPDSAGVTERLLAQPVSLGALAGPVDTHPSSM